VRAMLRKKDSRHNILVTRADEKIFAAVKRAAGKDARKAKFHELSGASPSSASRKLPKRNDSRRFRRDERHSVAEEAILTARVMATAPSTCTTSASRNSPPARASRKIDAGPRDYCVAGMEGALPSVVGGLSPPRSSPFHSVGYGAASRRRRAPRMLNSCASNVTVVNIDNGFGAACVASCINRL